MSAEIIQFVPKPNMERPTLLESVETKGAEFLKAAPLLDIALCEMPPVQPIYTAPDKDPA